MPSLPLALLADHAFAHPQDNKLYVTGGGIRSLSFTAFPATWPHLALAVTLEFTAEESKAPRDGPHVLQIIATGPDDTPPVPPVTVPFGVGPNPIRPDQPVYFHFVYNMDKLNLSAPGTYDFAVVIDDQQLGNVSLRAVEVSGPVLASDESRIRISDGYRAYLRGDLSAAREIFQDVVTRFPTVAVAYNNLGFVLLQIGEAAKAMQAFLKARELGVPQPEILDANLGCAHYVLGDPVAALLFFEQCIRAYGFVPPAILFGILDQQLFPVQLSSAADYVCLMMLDAAWSAFRSGDRVVAARYLEGADAADLARREDETGSKYSESLQSLKAQLA